jgi:hypothetical protein
MTVVKNVLNRIHVQRLLLAAALLGVSLSANANFIARTTHGNFEIVREGKSTVLKPPQTVMGNGNAVASSGTVTQGMGATAAGPTAAAGVNLGGTATVPVNGSNVPTAVKTNIGTDVLIPAAIAAVTCAKGGVVGAVVCAAGTVAAPFALQWLTSAGGRINPNTGALERSDPKLCTTGPCYWWKYRNVRYRSHNEACQAYADYQNGLNNGYRSEAYAVDDTTSSCFVKEVRISNGVVTLNGMFGVGVSTDGSRAPDSPTWYPSSMDDISPYMRDKPVDPGIVKEVTDAGQDLGNPPLQVTGPASVPGQSVISVTNNATNNSTTTTTTTTTNNYTYEGNKVTNTGSSTSSQTTTATKNPDGTTTTASTGTGTTTTTPGDPAEPPEQKVQCDKYPNSLGCAELDTPDGEIPKDTKNVSFSAEDPFGGGRCPADVMASFRAIGGQSLKIVDWTTFCGQAVPLRGLVLALASIMAFFIIMPGGVRE